MEEVADFLVNKVQKRTKKLLGKQMIPDMTSSYSFVVCVFFFFFDVRLQICQGVELRDELTETVIKKKIVSDRKKTCTSLALNV